MRFADLGLGPEVLKAVEEAGYLEPTPIQAQAIPHILMGRDVLGTAQTGTGKTAGFTLPMIEILAAGRAKARMPRSLIIEPTRELADQVARNFETYGKFHKLSMALLIGGVGMAEQEKRLDRGVDVLIVTPGRLLDMIERGKVMLTGVKILVIDEADRMMDMGFMPDVQKIVSYLPPIRQTLFFSATMPPEMRRLADSFLTNPKEVAVAPQATAAATVEQAILYISAGDKREALRQLLRAENVRNAIVFCNRKRDVNLLHKSLLKHGLNTAELHGDMAQSARMATLEKFKNGEISMLVASDVAARGLDVQGLSHVFNFDVPIHAEDYVHRIGRTGRAGQSGHAFTLATPAERKYVTAIEEMLGKPIPTIQLDAIAPPAPEEEEAAEARGGRRKRPARAKSEKAETEKAARPRRGRREKAAQPVMAALPEQTVPVEPPHAPVPRTAEAKKRPAKSRPEPRHQRRDEDGDERPVIGLGDHVPAFLMRPVPLRG
ncbi:MAG: DEAD/DEAH box helicase [Alphaproteobacteria bacterium]|nr:DEAD/DEAH box helicase [Alphaproteobacteria bacterium]